mmetsp:Transcript_3529/g.10158  ORF Transcript_3529/g.10158 Transcript_3529/m.10158 type:complete len:346 (-) Transcript_3529:106-1143(-)
MMKEKPVSRESLLTDEMGDSSRLAQVAALSDSLEYLAQVIEERGSAGSSAGTRGGNQPANSARHNSSNSRKGSSGGPVLSEGLTLLVNRCRSLSGRCLRALRLELGLTLLHYLQELPQNSLLDDDADTMEADERLGALTRSVSRFEDAVAPFLPSRYRMYVLGDGPTTAARIVRALLPEMEEMNPTGVERICKVCSLLQPILGALGVTGDSGAQNLQASREFDATRKYYGLLNERADTLIKFARERPTRYSPVEYLALLEVHVPGRNVTDEHRVHLAKALGREKGRKVAAARDAMKRERKAAASTAIAERTSSAASMIERLTVRESRQAAPPQQAGSANGNGHAH